MHYILYAADGRTVHQKTTAAVNSIYGFLGVVRATSTIN